MPSSLSPPPNNKPSVLYAKNNTYPMTTVDWNCFMDICCSTPNKVNEITSNPGHLKLAVGFLVLQIEVQNVILEKFENSNLKEIQPSIKGS